MVTSMPLYFVNASSMCRRKGRGTSTSAVPVPSTSTVQLTFVSRVSRLRWARRCGADTRASATSDMGRRLQGIAASGAELVESVQGVEAQSDRSGVAVQALGVGEDAHGGTEL